MEFPRLLYRVGKQWKLESGSYDLLNVANQAEFDAAKREGRVLHGLHSPFWAPEADQVVATGAEALASAAMELMPKR